ncbi:MAG: (deoxy)nucleoside triphosphate pyrophosphohydrolase [Bryobacteraceae bacterium]|nr:(deoxy)nucleoside triphosphate pyrophosphohydrolase [Bryobacteraceae bacterium]MDW8377746.1 (deoxy)nucleoside triphosphate pyrophosphohydrolase [Bryobacterales bacterium]
MAKVYRIPVVAGVLEKNGRILIAQRKDSDRHALKWEFPGGKVEKGESPRQALTRELREELGIHAVVGRELSRYEFPYPRGATILLIFLEVKSYRGELRNSIFQQIRWEERSKLPEYDFLEGDKDFVRRLAQGEFPRTSRPTDRSKKPASVLRRNSSPRRPTAKADLPPAPEDSDQARSESRTPE